jgi:glucose/arabinose dehydrogenase
MTPRFSDSVVVAAVFMAAPLVHAQNARARCAADNAGLTLPQGFCAQIVADSVGAPRHVVIAPNGDILLALRDTAAAGTLVVGSGGVLVLRDTNGDGVADQRTKFGPRGGTGIAFFEGYLYFAMDTAIVRWRWNAKDLAPTGTPETIVTGLPVQMQHAAKPIAIARNGSLYVNVGAPANSCQEQDRQEGSKGRDPCPLLETAGGIWRFDARRALQKQSDGTRWVTGIRNIVALTVGPDGSTLWGVQHGRDLLAGNWGKVHTIYTDEKSAENPGEELYRLDRGVDFGWPYCYYDVDLKQKVLAPEYGGDGGAQGRCSEVGQPLIAFPGHWAPESMVFYSRTQFPAEYRGGAFVAFHGSWNRGPQPVQQKGFNVSFVPFANGKPVGSYRVFADGFRGAPNEQRHRPMGMAVEQDGSLIVSDDRAGRVYRIRWTGRN